MCKHIEAAHVGYNTVVKLLEGRALTGCTACLECQGIRMSHVFHTVIWTETPTNITMSLGLEGAITTRKAAERVAVAYREFLKADAASGLEQAYFARVGILEMPRADPQLKHPEPRTDVDAIVAEIEARTTQKLEKRLS
jgi:hypothetical protein